MDGVFGTGRVRGEGGVGVEGRACACVATRSGRTRPGSSCASAPAPGPALSSAAATTTTSGPPPVPPSISESFSSSPVFSASISLMRSRSSFTTSRYNARPASGGVEASSSPLHARAVFDERKPQMRMRARSGSSAASGVGGSSSRGVAVREREGAVSFAGIRCAMAMAPLDGGVITVLGSRNVTCFPELRRANAGGGPGAGVMDLKMRTKRKDMTAMTSIRLVAHNTKRVWSRRASKPMGPPEAGRPRSVCAKRFMIR